MENLPPDFGYGYGEEDAGMQEFHKLKLDFEEGARVHYAQEELEELADWYVSLLGFDDDARVQLARVCTLGREYYPYCGSFLLAAARLHFASHALDRARACLDKARILDPSEAELYLLEGLLYTAKKERKQALMAFGEALEHAENRQEMLGRISEELLRNGDREQAVPFLEELLTVNILPAVVLEELLSYYMDCDLADKALSIAQQHVDAEPYNGDYWVQLGNVFRNAGLDEKAVWAFDYAILINEADYSAWCRKFETQYDVEDYPGAYNTYQQLIQHFSPEEVFQGMYAWVLYETGRLDEAQRLYTDLVRSNTEDAESWYGLGLTYQFSGDAMMGVHCLTRAVQLADEDLDYGLSLADCLFEAGFPERSNLEYARLAALFPDDAELWSAWATMLHEARDLNAAMDVINLALAQLPEDHRLLYMNAAIHYLGGRTQAAMEALQNALALNYREHQEMFKFAPELRQVGTISEMIARYAP